LQQKRLGRVSIQGDGLTHRRFVIDAERFQNTGIGAGVQSNKKTNLPGRRVD
jgi:hypothetical protein